MNVLSINTATRDGSVAITDGSSLIAEKCLNIQVTHSEKLLPAIDYLLKDTGRSLNDMEYFAVTIGPGSFTGIRIGLSTVKGLAWAAGRPAIGVSTLEALAHNIPYTDRDICPLIDARKGEVYTAIFRTDGERLVRVCEDVAIKPEMLVDMIERDTVMFGDGLERYGEFLKDRLGDRVVFAPDTYWFVHASIIGYIAYRRILRGDVDDPISILPIYIRPSEAELKRMKSLSRL